MTEATLSEIRTVDATPGSVAISGANPGKVAVAFSPILNALTGLLVTGVLARLLTSEYFGLYTSWIYAASILAIVFSLGFPAANSYLAAKYPEYLEVIFAHSLATSMTLGVAGALTLLWYIQTDSIVVPAFILVLIPLLVPMTVAQSSINGALLGAGRHRLYAFVSGFQGVLNLAFCVLLLVLPIDSQQAFFLAIGGYIAATALALTLNLASTGRIGRPNLAFLWECLPQSTPLWIHSVFTVLLQRSDVMVLSYLLSPAEVGTFALASKLSEALNYLPQGVSLAVFSDLARSDRDQAIKLAASLSRLCLLISIAGSIPVYLLFTSALPNFVPSASKAAALLPLMLAAGVFLGPIYLLCSFSQAIGQPRDVLAITGIAVLVKLSALVVITPLGGLNAVPMALACAAFLSVCCAFAIASRRSGVGIRKLVAPSLEDLALFKKLICFAKESSK